MKHRFNIMGVGTNGYAVGVSVIANDMIDAIKLCRNSGLNPHSVCQAEQVNANAVIGFVGYYNNVQLKENRIC